MKYIKNYIKSVKIILIILLFSALSVLCGCTETQHNNTESANTLTVLCTGFSQYDWTCNIVGDAPGIKVETMLKPGIDIHNYQPSADDIVKISNCSMIICTGGESDKPIIDIADSLGDNKPIIINMIDELEPHLIKATENHSHQQNYTDFDEHVWLSVKNAYKLCRIISDKIISLDPDNIEKYKSNTDAYLSKLSDLDKRYSSTIENSFRREIVFADRYPFAYLARDYGLTCYCAFPGCSAETDASFETILSLSSRLDELNLTSIMTIDGGTLSIDEAVIANAKSKNIKTLSLNSLQSVSADEVNAGLSYLSAMENNLEIIKESLN